MKDAVRSTLTTAIEDAAAWAKRHLRSPMWMVGPEPSSLVVIAWLLVATTTLAGCSAEHRDVSANSPYAAHVGQICEVLRPLRAHGYTLKIERDKKTDGISIWNPGFTGPEMTFVVYLQTGHRLTLLAARECSNCPFDRNPEYRVQVTPEPREFAGMPAYLRDTALTDGTLRCSGTG